RDLLATIRSYEEKLADLEAEKRLMTLQLAHQATHDELTGLLNRQAFDAHLQRALDEIQASNGGHDGNGPVSHVLFFMDLDQFKVVNDTCGHLAGDELLCRVTTLLQDNVRDGDLVARLGGDELAVLMPGCTPAEAERRTRVFHRALQTFRFTWREKTFK